MRRGKGSKVLYLGVVSLFTYLSSAAPALSTYGALRELNATCRTETSIFDYSAKDIRERDLAICPAEAAAVPVTSLIGKRADQQEDYTCSENVPCRNKACCPKKTGWCNYGPDACGTSNTSPNDVCWSNCDAKAECGRFADPPGKECPLNVCCSPYGFCGMTDEFCKVTDDKDKSCQSNCEQKGSGSSNGNVRKRVVGYYEAWVNDRKCNGMPIEQIPVGSLTHLMFSFGYITPGSYEIAPMDGVDASLFTKITAMKKRNKGLKVMIALGGWTYNDPGPTQKVFSEMASSGANRAKFIANLMSFMREYAFDGVDFDWEYPGADDRGGSARDGVNLTLLIRQLRAAIKQQPIPYEISFTAPTSYWYLRHFDIKNSVAAADFVNVMSYDLHGIWDSYNPIGSHVLAHTNLTEIKLALDLYWRNDVPPEKINMGLGFYGRTFELSDPSCYKPGCTFKGGAAPGPCTKNSGTLAYREIKDIIAKKKLKPFYDKTNQVKYIVWDQTQWASYDDPETIDGKIKFANSLGLGGVLIWSVDQDTDDLEALAAVVGDKSIGQSRKQRRAEDAAYWQKGTAQDCYATDCGASCKPGYITLTTTKCSKGKKKFSVCCPLSNAPNPDKCTWRGTAPQCNGRCHDGEVPLVQGRYGNGKRCDDGHKIYCCEVEKAKENKCYWSGMNKKCKSPDQALTFKGTFWGDVVDIASFAGLIGATLEAALDAADVNLDEYLCCPPDDFNRWKNCKWAGKPGSCYDDHCDINKQVQIANAYRGGGESCSPQASRTRVFCCDPPNGPQLFPPVPLENLFPSPPTGDDVHTDFDLEVDNTWGDGKPDTDSKEPNDDAFQFYVLASPEEIQISMDKRDGSHWELFNCNDAVSEEGQTIQAVCMDGSEDSNCKDIYKGKGVPGTILQMPQGQGCGPGKYAVAKSMVESKNQTLPRHLSRRDLSHKPVVYDLTFDYDFERVPRDFGDTQMRVDYSNEPGYWDRIVAQPGEHKKKKKKRSLDDVGGNHKRWLEEEWRDDLHFGALSHQDLHKRWFGSSVIEWIKGILSEGIKMDKRYDYDEQIEAIILQEDWKCETEHAKYQAKLDASVVAAIQMSTSFGFTLITKLTPGGLDLKNSFLHFDNEGKIEAIFTLDALARVDWDSHVINLANIPLPGAAFKIPGIMTIGPQFSLDGRLKAALAVQGRVEARVTIAEWDVRQVYPEQSGDLAPSATHKPSRDFNTKGLANPSFNVSVEAFGSLEAHMLPTIAFGIKFADKWDVDDCTVELVADGWIRLRAKSTLVGSGCGFGYAVDAGAELKVQAKVPKQFGWNPQSFPLATLQANLIPGNGDDYKCLTDGAAHQARDVIESQNHTSVPVVFESSAVLRKRLVPFGPVIHLPSAEKLCPNQGGSPAGTECSQSYPVSDVSQAFSRRDMLPEGSEDPLDLHLWEKRGSKAPIAVCSERSGINLKLPTYPDGGPDSGSVVFDNEDWNDCNNYNLVPLNTHPPVPKTAKDKDDKWVAEHVLEASMLKSFLESDKYKSLCGPLRLPSSGWKTFHDFPTGRKTPFQFIGEAYPGTASHRTEIIDILQVMNLMKQATFRGAQPRDPAKMDAITKDEADIPTALKTMKYLLMTYKYISHPTIKGYLAAQVRRVGDNLDIADRIVGDDNNGGKRLGLQAKWLEFAKTRTEEAVTRISDMLDTYIVRMEDLLEPFKEEDDDPARASRRAKIKALREAIDGKGAFSNPL